MTVALLIIDMQHALCSGIKSVIESSDARLLLVCHCEREEGEVIRIISARRATPQEAKFYQGE
jgi:uncharacterized DUF497 family protein